MCDYAVECPTLVEKILLTTIPISTVRRHLLKTLYAAKGKPNLVALNRNPFRKGEKQMLEENKAVKLPDSFFTLNARYFCCGYEPNRAMIVIEEEVNVT